jgi:hypothetical protein
MESLNMLSCLLDSKMNTDKQRDPHNRASEDLATGADTYFSFLYSTTLAVLELAEALSHCVAATECFHLLR